MSGAADTAPAGRRRVYLVRHGQVAHVDAQGRRVPPERVELTALGRDQAAAVGGLLREAGVAVDRIVCSDLPRARQTAEVIVTASGLPAAVVEQAPDFREPLGGGFGGASPEELQVLIEHTYQTAADPGARYLGGEPFLDAWARVVAGWEELLADEGWQRLLLVAHDAVNRVILSHVAGAGMTGLRIFEQDLGCVNILDVGSPRPYLRAVNLTPPDPAKEDAWLTSMERVWQAVARARGL